MHDRQQLATKHSSATRIQARARGMHDRRRVAGMRDGSNEGDIEYSADQERAAVRIQARARGMHDRRRVAGLRGSSDGSGVGELRGDLAPRKPSHNARGRRNPRTRIPRLKPTAGVSPPRKPRGAKAGAGGGDGRTRQMPTPPPGPKVGDLRLPHRHRVTKPALGAEVPKPSVMVAGSSSISRPALGAAPLTARSNRSARSGGSVPRGMSVVVTTTDGSPAKVSVDELLSRADHLEDALRKQREFAMQDVGFAGSPNKRSVGSSPGRPLTEEEERLRAARRQARRYRKYVQLHSHSHTATATATATAPHARTHTARALVFRCSVPVAHLVSWHREKEARAMRAAAQAEAASAQMRAELAEYAPPVACPPACGPPPSLLLTPCRGVGAPRYEERRKRAEEAAKRAKEQAKQERHRRFEEARRARKAKLAKIKAGNHRRKERKVSPARPQPLYKRMEQEFEQQVVMPELEKRKQKLAELRSMLGQPSATELERHRREHDAAQAAMRQRAEERLQQAQREWQEKQPHVYKGRNRRRVRVVWVRVWV